MSIELIAIYQSAATLSATVFNGSGSFSQSYSLAEIGATGVYKAIISSPAAGHYYVNAIVGGVVVGVGEFDTDGTSEVFPSSSSLTLPMIESSTVLAKEATLTSISSRIPAALVGGKMDSNIATINAGAITAASIAPAALNSKGDWLLAINYSAPPSIAGLATTAQLNSAVVNIKGLQDRDLTQVFNNAPAVTVDLSPITSKLPSSGANIAGEGAIAKNLDQIVATSVPDPTLAANVVAVKAKTDKLTFTPDNKVEAKIIYSASDLQPPCC